LQRVWFKLVNVSDYSFVNKVFSVSCPLEIIPLFFGATLSHSVKNLAEFAQLQLDAFLRRLIATYAVHIQSSKLVSYFRPCQLDVGVYGGREAALHATRQFLSSFDERMSSADNSRNKWVRQT
jgi:hypothetical protein